MNAAVRASVRVPRRAAWQMCVLSLLPMLSACVEPLEEPAAELAELQPSETRRVELRYLRFDVTNYEKTLTREDLLALPPETQRRLWLLDLDLSNSVGSPRFIENTLSDIQLQPSENLDTPSRNLQGLLRMTPDNADLSGTSLEELITLAPLVGISPVQALSDLFLLNPEDTFLSLDTLAEAILDNVIGSHPNAQFRPGPRTAENPEGLYPVTDGALPITLADIVSDFDTFSETFGPSFADGAYHPGFIVGDSSAAIVADDFSLTVRANANALPFKGLDLEDASVASLNSIGSQIQSLFNFDDPAWLTIRGLVPGTPVINQITFQVLEDPRFHAAGISPLPRPQGSSTAWLAPQWSIEYVIIDAAWREFGSLTNQVSYPFPNRDEDLFTLRVTDGWSEFVAAGDLGSPPPPSYAWDVLSEVAQVRLHDGGLAEGSANSTFTLYDIPVGVDSRVIEQTVRDNLRSDPASLLDVAESIIDTSRGNPDFYYVQTLDSRGEPVDWLFFIDEQDIPVDPESGLQTRPYAYAQPGFWADLQLTQRLGSRELVDGDELRWKLRIQPGDTLWVQDDRGVTHRIEVLPKPSRSRILLDVTREP
jgi:hypothetical protein